MSTDHTETYSKGDLIIKEGDQGNKAFLINKGHVEVRKDTIHGQSTVISVLGPGQMFGEMCLFDDKPRSASVLALGNVEVTIIHKNDFTSYLKTTPPQIKVMIDLLLNRLRQTSYLVASLKLEVDKSTKDSSYSEQAVKDMDFPT